MLFDTPVYFFFLAIVLLAYWQLKWRKQNILLLAASYFFYGWWDWRFLSLIWISTIVDYFCAKSIGASDRPAHRKVLLSISVALNLSFLGFFKYYDFFAASLSDSLALLGINAPVAVLGIILPPGISFYTFQELAYLVDVYNRKLEPSKSLVDYALFISLFPHLIAGPIQRPSHLLPQVQHPRTLDSSRFFDGIMLILSGLFRKSSRCRQLRITCQRCVLRQAWRAEPGRGTHRRLCIRLADLRRLQRLQRHGPRYRPSCWAFHFMVNFRQPYLSRSIQEFWRRWHISLSTWLRDYLYIRAWRKSPRGG